MWVHPKSSAAKSLKKSQRRQKVSVFFFFHFFVKKISEIFERRQKSLFFLLGLTPAAGVGRSRLQSGGGPGAVDSLKFANAHTRWALRARLFDAANSKNFLLPRSNFFRRLFDAGLFGWTFSLNREKILKFGRIAYL